MLSGKMCKCNEKSKQKLILSIGFLGNKEFGEREKQATKTLKK